MSVCFSGYRPEKLPWGGDESDPRCAVLKKRLYDAAESACAEGYRHFICGMARGVDLYACEAVLQLREKYRDVTVEAAIPCPSQPEGWPEEEQRRWHDLVDRCDYETVVQDHYDAGCMQRRNRYMVDHAAPAVPSNMPCAADWMWSSCRRWRREKGVLIMTTYTYTPKGVCSRRMTVALEDGVIRDVRIEGGCNGNLQGISHLVIGMKAQDAIDRMRGIRCGGKPSSCPDQLATALTQALEQAAQQGA